MKSQRANRRAMLAACAALALTLVGAHLGYQALAGVAGLPVSASVSSLEPGLEAGSEREDNSWLRMVRPSPSDDLVAIAASAQRAGEAACPTLEEAYAAISDGTQGADIGAISLALGEVQADPTGAVSPDSSPLAQRLRAALGLEASSPICPSIMAALSEAVQLAQIASAAEAIGPVTGSVGAPNALSPSYSTVGPGTAGGARGHGYCADLSQCVG
jgi:hypothetical protein